MTTIDKTPPKLTFISPQKGASSIALDLGLVFTFNKNVKSGTGIITISNGTSDTRIISVNASSNEVTFTGSVLTVHPLKKLLPTK